MTDLILFSLIFCTNLYVIYTGFKLRRHKSEKITTALCAIYNQKILLVEIYLPCSLVEVYYFDFDIYPVSNNQWWSVELWKIGNQKYTTYKRSHRQHGVVTPASYVDKYPCRPCCQKFTLVRAIHSFGIIIYSFRDLRNFTWIYLFCDNLLKIFSKEKLLISGVILILQSSSVTKKGELLFILSRNIYSAKYNTNAVGSF